MRLHQALMSGLLIGIATASGARAGTLPGVSIDDAWMRVLTPEVPAGGYFRLRNASPDPLMLTGASSPDCGMLMLHESSSAGGMESMRDVGAITVPAGGTLTFAPGGYHLMCMSPSPAMKPGQTAPVTLHFETGQSISASFVVRGARGS